MKPIIKQTITQNLPKILDLPFLTVYFNEDLQIFETYWQRQDHEMSPDEFKNHLEQFAELFAWHLVKAFYVDTRAYHIIMDVDIQTWHDQNIVPKYLTAGVQKIAFVIPNEFITALSIEQTFQEPQAKQLLVRHFENETDAKTWLKESPVD